MKIGELRRPWHEDDGYVWIHELTPLWHLGYYDGPLSMICRNEKGEHFYVATPFESERSTWCVWRLTEDEWAFESRKHAAFVEHVGRHTDYDPETFERSVGLDLKPQPEWRKFYDNPEWKKRISYEARDFDGICARPA